jgi:hypothetical protein
MSYANGPRIVTDGLVLHLDAANRKSYPGSGNTWYDLSGNGNNGTRTNAVFNSSNGGTFSFDGNGDFITISSSDSLKPTTGITIFSWTKSSNYGNMTILGKNNSFQNQTFSANGIENSIYSGGWNQPRTAQNLLSTTNWNNIVNTYTTQDYKQRTYLNCSEVLTHTRTGGAAGNINQTNDNLYIGSWGGSVEYFNGFISVLMMYDRALSPTEIQQNYNALKGRYGLT